MGARVAGAVVGVLVAAAAVEAPMLPAVYVRGAFVADAALVVLVVLEREALATVV